jgi:hypothetical protein
VERKSVELDGLQVVLGNGVRIDRSRWRDARLP